LPLRSAERLIDEGGGEPIIIDSRRFRKGPERMKRIENAELLIALFSRNNRGTVRRCAEVIGEGLRAHLGFLKPVLINLDCASPDGTVEEFQKADLHRTIEFFSIEAPRDRTSAFKALLDAAQRLEARFIVSVDAGVPSIEPAWLSQLAVPLIEESFDMAAPLYYDPPFSHLFRDHLHAPLFAALYGVALSNPALEHFSFSGKHVDSLITQISGEEKPGVFNPVLKAALLNGWKLCESVTGDRTEDMEPQKRLGLDAFLSSIPLIESIEETRELWNRDITPALPPMYGEYRYHLVAGAPCNMETMWEAFRDTLKKHFTMLSGVFPRELFKELCTMSDIPWRHGGIPVDIWGEIVCQLTAASMQRKELRKSLPSLLPGFIAGRAVGASGKGAGLIAESRERPETKAFTDKRASFLELCNR